MAKVTEGDQDFMSVPSPQSIMSSKNKILILIQSDIYVRNYFATDALAELERKFDCCFVYSSNVANTSMIKAKQRTTRMYRVNAADTKLQMKFYKLMTWRFRHKSSTFYYRVKRTLQPKGSLKRPYVKFALNNLKWLSSYIGVIYRKTRLRVLASRLVYPIIFRRFLKKLQPNDDITEILKEFEPDLILIPTSSYDPDANSTLVLAKTKKIPTLCVVDNWDNMSSKSTMWVKPDHLAVWGKQSANHAVNIQGVTWNRVHIIGTPRFDSYFKLRQKKLPMPFEHRYILFLGTSLAFDEAGALEVLNNVVDKNQDILSGIKIVYRPHPWRSGRDTIAGKNLTHVLIDPQLESNYFNRETKISFQPDLAYYPSLISNAELVMGGLTSMIIESLIFGQKYIAFAHDDGINVTNQRSVFLNSEHFRGIENVKLVEMCWNLDELEGLIIGNWKNRNKNFQAADQDREYFLYHDDFSFSVRLSQLVTKIVCELPERKRVEAQINGL